jgi:hypothetical protein
MIDRIKGRIAFICDECQDGLETDEYELPEATKVMKEQGWRNVPVTAGVHPHPKLKSGAKFINYCPNCYEHVERERDHA